MLYTTEFIIPSASFTPFTFPDYWTVCYMYVIYSMFKAFLLYENFDFFLRGSPGGRAGGQELPVRDSVVSIGNGSKLIKKLLQVWRVHVLHNF